MTLIDLIEFAAEELKAGKNRDEIDATLISDMGVEWRVARAILETLGDNGRYLRSRFETKNRSTFTD